MGVLSGARGPQFSQSRYLESCVQITHDPVPLRKLPGRKVFQVDKITCGIEFPCCGGPSIAMYEQQHRISPYMRASLDNLADLLTPDS